MSWVFLTGSYVYKLKKPVRFAFLDYSTRDARKRMCRQEVKLNRRLAAWVYLGVVPLTREDDGGLALDGFGEAVDWLVKMRRLPARGLLDEAIAQGPVDPARLSPAADLLARFYARRTLIERDYASYAASLSADAQENRTAVSWSLAPGSESRVTSLVETLTGFVRREQRLFAVRAQRLSEGHGDLRPEHIYLGPPAAVIDCIEFNRAFRINDPVDELAFLAMECERLDAEELGDVFLDSYRAATGDRPPAPLLSFYKARRALLRARLSLAHLEEPVDDPDKWHGRTAHYLSIGEHHAGALH